MEGIISQIEDTRASIREALPELAEKADAERSEMRELSNACALWDDDELKRQEPVWPAL